MTLYDEVAYPSSPFRQTHPNRLAAPARLLGLNPAPVEGARVLEIGCGDGANLIPLAANYPQGRFVGFDIAAGPIARGGAVATALGLANIRLEALDILQASPAELGTFDYIIAHGVYSWVPEAVCEAMMKLIADCLAPEGLAVVSYNALPGCRTRQTLREMLLHHLREVSDLAARIAGAREFLSVLVQTYREDDPIEAALRAEAAEMLNRSPNVVFHDELADHYRPAYLHEFAAHAGRHGMAVVAEAEPMWLDDSVAPNRTTRPIQALGISGRLEVQQYRDFVQARQFRQTILRRGPPLTAEIDLSKVGELYASLLGAPGEVNLERQDQPIIFRTPSGVNIELTEPELKAPIAALATAFPQALRIGDLGPDLEAAFIQFWGAGLVELLAGPDPFVSQASEHPTASPLARLQAARELPITTLRHGEVRVDDPGSRHFITLLDGTRDREALAVEMARFFQAPMEQVRPGLTASLEGMARLPLLVA